MPEGDIKIAAAPAPETHQAPSQYTCHGVSITGPSVYLEGSVQYVMKYASTCDLMVLLFSKVITCYDNSIAHFPILLEQSQKCHSEAGLSKL
jgi:hypothetical protein